MIRRVHLFAVLGLVVAFLAGLALGKPAGAQQFPTVRTLMKQDLADLQGFEGQILRVDVAPGAGIGGHRHSGHMFVFVAEGELVSQLEDGERITYAAGDTWYEHPMMLHTHMSNPSETEGATAIIFVLTEKGKPQTILEPQAH